MPSSCNHQLRIHSPSCVPHVLELQSSASNSFALVRLSIPCRACSSPACAYGDLGWQRHDSATATAEKKRSRRTSSVPYRYGCTDTLRRARRRERWEMAISAKGLPRATTIMEPHRLEFCRRASTRSSCSAPTRHSIPFLRAKRKLGGNDDSLADKKKRRSELRNLREELGPFFQPPASSKRSAATAAGLGVGSEGSFKGSRGGVDRAGSGSGNGNGNGGGSGGGSGIGSVVMSQRNRSGRGSNRNNSNNAHGEEAQIWDACKSQMADIVSGINAENDSLGRLVDMDKEVGGLDPEKIPTSSLKQMEQLCRQGVKFSDANIGALKAMTEQLKILRAVVVAKEEIDSPAAVPGKRTASTRASGGSSKRGDRSSNRDRDSMPPKADSVEPPATTTSASAVAAALAKSKVAFSKGDEVAFKPRTANGDQSSDWILGEVAVVLGEGKSRRYKVLDIEPDDTSKQREYRSSASSMIAITPEAQAGSLKDWEAGKVVLALYPNTTTFYKAEVHSMDGDGRVNLKFEGENDSTTLQQVERRFVIEYRQ
ncbi:hypothetical protein RJ55_04505 [Drechmeria coniospora]|nr:hypothetical protein RJ55_04505 [Drechmeria coniospora]